MERAREQILIYYVSYAVANVEASYPLIEKFVYALVMANLKLRPYFEAHKVTVTNQPLKNILQRLDISGRLLRSTADLSLYCPIFKGYRCVHSISGPVPAALS